MLLVRFLCAFLPPTTVWAQPQQSCSQAHCFHSCHRTPRINSDSVTGLLVAGRCISAAREGLASMRVMPSCMFTGEAAGTAAALAVQRGLQPHQLDGRELKPLLMTPDALM